MASIFTVFLLCVIFFSDKTFSQMVGTTKSTTTLSPSPITCPSLDEIVTAMEILFKEQTRQLTKKLVELEEKLNDLSSCKQMGPSELFLGIYENLTIFNEWTEIYNKAYSHSTTSEELRQAANRCRSNRVVVGAINGENSTMFQVAAVGPKRVLTLNNTMNDAEEIENVRWVLESGRTFGFQPVQIDDYEEPRSELFLGWSIDVKHGGWRAGKQTNLYQNSIWRKVIYCMPAF